MENENEWNFHVTLGSGSKQPLKLLKFDNLNLWLSIHKNWLQPISCHWTFSIGFLCKTLTIVMLNNINHTSYL